MNNEYYKQVLEDVQKDLSEVEQTISELHGVERYVQRKMDSDSDDGNSKLSYNEYQTLLDDIREDVDGARSKIGELRGVGNYARERLKAAGVEVGDLKTPAAKPQPAPAPKPQAETKPAAAAKPSEPATDDDEPTRQEASPVKPGGQGDTMKTVEFGPDGFPMK